MKKIIGLLLAGTLLASSPAFAKKEKMEINMVFVSQEVELPPALSNLEEAPDDLGLQGVKLGLKDNNTTGRFMGQSFLMDEVMLREDDDAVKAVQEQIKAGQKLFILDLPAKSLEAVMKTVTDKDEIGRAHV